MLTDSVARCNIRYKQKGDIEMNLYEKTIKILKEKGINDITLEDVTSFCVDGEVVEITAEELAPQIAEWCGYDI